MIHDRLLKESEADSVLWAQMDVDVYLAAKAEKAAYDALVLAIAERLPKEDADDDQTFFEETRDLFLGTLIRHLIS